MFDKLLQVMDMLLGPEGCPWDRAQTHQSLCGDMLEECGEAVQAIKENDMAALCDELGDVLHQVIFHAKLAEANGDFTLEDVINGLNDKLVRRHSHVFGTDKAATAEEVERLWEANKRNERKGMNETAAKK
jgi:tetrapyrrole methylase family protein/MazG family protein